MATQYGMTEQGLKIKRQIDIQGELEDDFRGTYGTGVDVDQRRPIGMFVGIFSERESLIWELLQQVYLAGTPDYAEGAQFDEVAKLNNLTRLPASYSKQKQLRAYGTEGTEIPKGAFISVEGNSSNRFATDAIITVGPGTDSEQRIDFSSVPNSGTFTLIFGDEVTAPLNYNVNAIALQVALRALTSLSAVLVSGSIKDGFVIDFADADGNKEQPPLQVGSNTLTAQTEFLISPVADVAGSLAGKYFVLDAQPGYTIGFWYKVSGVGTVPGGASSQDLAYMIAISTNDDLATVCEATRMAIALTNYYSYAVTTDNVIAVRPIYEGPIDDFDEGTSGFTIEVDNLGADVGDVVITPEVTIEGLSPHGDGTATATEAGEVEAPAGSLTVIETTVSGWDSVTNLIDAEVGREIETTAEFKLRRIQEIGNTASTTKNAIKAALLQTTDVLDARVYSNVENTTVDGIPPKSVRPVLLGGAPVDIATTLLNAVAAGIKTFGAQSYVVNDDDGFPQTQRWDYAEEILIYVKADLVTNDSFPQNGLALLDASVLAYGTALTMGDDVIVYPYLMAAFNAVTGIDDIDLAVGIAPDPTDDDNIEIDADQIARFDSGRIEINAA